MDILLVSTGLAPYVRAGAMADMVAALSKTLRQHGHKVTVVLPRYPHFERSGLLIARRLTPITFDWLGTRASVTVYDGRLPTGVDITLLDIPGLFDREDTGAPSGDACTHAAPDFALFCRAVVDIIATKEKAGAKFDAVHVHDWPSALVPVFAKHLQGEGATDASTRYVLTIHNVARQGIVPVSALASLGIPQSLFHPEGVEFYGKVNILKAGILFADVITTVSPQYARDIQTSQYGHGLEGVLAFHSSKLKGITCGIDDSVWNPTTDAALPARYDAEDCSNKALCKGTLLADTGLEITVERPVLAVVSPLEEHVGLEVLIEAFPKLFRSDLAMVVVGDGQIKLTEQMAAARERYRPRFAFMQSPSEVLMHRAFGGADMVLIPPRYEACGTTHLHGQRYGALPIGFPMGGIVDTVVDCDASLETGTGFLCDAPTPSSMVAAVQRALVAYQSPRWAALRRRVIRLDLGWDRPAHRFALLYRRPGEEAVEG